MTEEKKAVFLKVANSVYDATDSLNKALLPMLEDTPAAREAYEKFEEERKTVSAACYTLANRIMETILAADNENTKGA